VRLEYPARFGEDQPFEWPLYGLGERQIVASARGLAVKLPEISNRSFWAPSVNEYGRTTPAVRLCGMYTTPSRHDLIQFLQEKDSALPV
jgi:hypothetical protein